MRRYMLPVILFLTDILILCFSIWLAVILRFGGVGSFQNHISTLALFMPLYIFCHVIFFYCFKLYSRIWKYAGIKEMLGIVGANICGMVLFLLVRDGLNVLTSGGFPVSRLLLLLVLFFNIFFIAASRLFVRWASYLTEKADKENDTVDKRVLIVGAGDAGNVILRDLRQRDHRQVIGFIDDDPNKTGKILNGIPVLGTRQDIHRMVKDKKIQEIIIAIPSLEADKLSELGQICSTAGHDVEVKILPSFFTSMDEVEINYQNLRPLEIEDLLQRDPVKLDVKTFGKYLTGKTVLVTGAGGSIGSEICRQILKRNPAKLILLGRGEGSIYEINRELQLLAADKEQVVPYIMNITNREGMEEVFRQFKPQIVFHAAAHKHVPLMEAQPREAVWNNVMGFCYTAEPAVRYGTERFVLISTDKAVNPTSVMGATKRLTEMIGQSLNRHYGSTKFIAVRFGNVLGSRGSVVPLFKKQIAAGGPLTVTHPDMTRYFMTIPEASQLVIEAGSMGDGGEVFELDMGKPVKIVDLTKNMIRLSGLVPDQDIKIRFTGLRPGEKLFEELLTAEEGTEVTDHAKIRKAILQEHDPALLKEEIRKLNSLQEDGEIIAQLQRIIPTYTPNHF